MLNASEPSRVYDSSLERRALRHSWTPTQRSVRLETVAKTAKSFKVLMVASECAGLFQTGGLGHAVSGVLDALNETGVETDLLMPRYLKMAEIVTSKINRTYRIGLDWHSGRPRREARFEVSRLKAEGPRTFLMGHQAEFDNYFDNRAPGRPHYGPSHLEGEAWGAWSRAVADFILESRYDLVRLNDHHCALVALFLHQARSEGRRTPRVEMVVHNLAFQGVHPRSMMATLNIPERYFDAFDGIEFYGQVNFMKAGLLYSDFAGTVSAQHALELATVRGGAGLDGLIRRLVYERRFSGILNGINGEEWDPSKATHPAVQWTFSRDDLGGKARGKAFIQKEFGFAVNAQTPVFILTSRVTEQKGFDYLPRAIERFLAAADVQMIAIGDGDAESIRLLKQLEIWYPEKFCYRPFSVRDEKLLTAYGDFFVNAAWFEPSGLNQLFSLKNGTIPIVSRVGGLADSVVDAETGLLFDIHWNESEGYDSYRTSQSILTAFHRAANLFAQEPSKIQAMRKAGMILDNSWRKRVDEVMVPLFIHILSDGPARLQARDRLGSLTAANSPPEAFIPS